MVLIQVPQTLQCGQISGWMRRFFLLLHYHLIKSNTFIVKANSSILTGQVQKKKYFLVRALKSSLVLNTFHFSSLTWRSNPGGCRKKWDTESSVGRWQEISQELVSQRWSVSVREVECETGSRCEGKKGKSVRVEAGSYEWVKCKESLSHTQISTPREFVWTWQACVWTSSCPHEHVPIHKPAVCVSLWVVVKWG